ncbi:ATP-binding protein [Bacillus sp. 31A1R]|uniref:ATP-binding protein n=1 Tax=Robertmurraya mangrovi TaxID=3098077 RepID=A0ABU5J401_9BACI|nr:ATP-binding protein [Bacillus sp. 31A1R]MDZ5474092.1 ATP-binding protein [Bacillus sp. 31A1R]
MYRTVHTFCTQAEYRELRSTLHKEIQLILGNPVSFLMEVAVNEAINNALKSNRDQKPVTLCIRVTNYDRLIIRIKDNGKGFNAQDALSSVTASPEAIFEEKLLEESGRGLSIIASASDKVYYNRKGNEVLMMKYIRTL